MPLLTLPQATSAQSTFPIDHPTAARWVVEFSPTTNPTATPVWVDVTAYVQTIRIKRGRQRLLDRYETGTATVVLKNDDRRFDPAHVSGPYYGGLLPMRRWRIRSQYGNATYPRFVGFVSSYRQTYALSNNQSTCTVELHDAFKMLSLVTPSSPFALQLGTENPAVWYRLAEGAGTTLFDSSPYGRDGTYNSAGVTYSATGLLTSDANTCVTFNGTTGSASSSSMPAHTNGIALEAWFSTTAAVDQTIVCKGDNTRSVALARIGLNASGQVYWSWCIAAYDLTFTYVSVAATYADGLSHHVAIHLNENSPYTSIAYAVDGSTTPTVTGSYGANVTAPAGVLSVGQIGTSTGYFNGKIDEVVGWVDPTVTQATIIRLAAHSTFGAAPFVNDPTGTRIGRVLTAVGWPSEDRDLNTGNSTLQALDYTGSAMDHLQAVAITEQGQFFHGRDGRMRFRGRHSTIGAVSLFTFTDSSGVRFRDLAWSYDDTLIRNSVTAQRVGGGEITITDPTSIAAYYPRTYTQSGLLYANDNQTRDFAQWIVNRYKDPALRVEQMTLLPENTPATMYPAAFGLELGDLVTVQRTPQGVGSVISRDVLIEGYEEVVGLDSYSIVFAISEADTASYWILGDAVYSVLGSTTRLAF